MVFATRPDIRVFALFVVLNGAGYDLECGSHGMHLCRIAVREALSGWSSPRKERVQALLASTHQWLFLVWALNRELAGVPGGKVSLNELFADHPFRSIIVATAHELDEVMPAALKEVPWQSLWAQHREAHELQAEAYRRVGEEAIEQVLRFSPAALPTR